MSYVFILVKYKHLVGNSRTSPQPTYTTTPPPRPLPSPPLLSPECGVKSQPDLVWFNKLQMSSLWGTWPDMLLELGWPFTPRIAISAWVPATSLSEVLRLRALAAKTLKSLQTNYIYMASTLPSRAPNKLTRNTRNNYMIFKGLIYYIAFPVIQIS